MAQFYGPDVANNLIHEALHTYSDGLLLVSKVGAFRDDRGRCLRDRLAAVDLRMTDDGNCPPTSACPSMDNWPRWSRYVTKARSPASASPPPPGFKSSRPSPRPTSSACKTPSIVPRLPGDRALLVSFDRAVAGQPGAHKLGGGDARQTDASAPRRTSGKLQDGSESHAPRPGAENLASRSSPAISTSFTPWLLIFLDLQASPNCTLRRPASQAALPRPALIQEKDRGHRGHPLRATTGLPVVRRRPLSVGHRCPGRWS